MSRQNKKDIAATSARVATDVAANDVTATSNADEESKRTSASDNGNAASDTSTATNAQAVTDSRNYKKLMEEVLLRKAKGYSFEEKTEEFAVVDGEMTLVKRKVSTKYVQPDVGALKALAELNDEVGDLSEMTDEQLKAEKLRLLKLLKMCEEGKTNDPDEETGE